MIKLCLRLTLLYQWLSQLVYLKVNGVEVYFSWLASLSSSVVSLGNGNLVGNERRRQARRTSIPRVLRHASVNMFPTHFLRHFTPSCWFDVICVDVAISRLSPSLEARRSQFADHKSQIADRRSQIGDLALGRLIKTVLLAILFWHARSLRFMHYAYHLTVSLAIAMRIIIFTSRCT